MFIEYLRNGQGSTAICPWSTRARSGAPCAVPVGWDELPTMESASAFDLADSDGAYPQSGATKLSSDWERVAAWLLPCAPTITVHPACTRLSDVYDRAAAVRMAQEAMHIWFSAGEWTGSLAFRSERE
jgi:DNA primase